MVVPSIVRRDNQPWHACTQRVQYVVRCIFPDDDSRPVKKLVTCLHPYDQVRVYTIVFEQGTAEQAGKFTHARGLREREGGYVPWTIGVLGRAGMVWLSDKARARPHV